MRLYGGSRAILIVLTHPSDQWISSLFILSDNNVHFHYSTDICIELWPCNLTVYVLHRQYADHVVLVANCGEDKFGKIGTNCTHCSIM